MLPHYLELVLLNHVLGYLIWASHFQHLEVISHSLRLEAPLHHFCHVYSALVVELRVLQQRTQVFLLLLLQVHQLVRRLYHALNAVLQVLHAYRFYLVEVENVKQESYFVFWLGLGKNY